MFSIDLKKFTKISLSMITLGVMVFGYFCIDNLTHHQINIGGINNHSSVVQSVESCCSTTFSKYSKSLMSNFNLPSRADNYLLVSIISVLLIFVINPWFRSRADIGSALQKLFLWRNPNLIPFDSLKLAFSNGIINPKVF